MNFPETLTKVIWKLGVPLSHWGRSPMNFHGIQKKTRLPDCCCWIPYDFHPARTWKSNPPSIFLAVVGWWQGLSAFFNWGFYHHPKNRHRFYDGGWLPGYTHTLLAFERSLIVQAYLPLLMFPTQGTEWMHWCTLNWIITPQKTNEYVFQSLFFWGELLLFWGVKFFNYMISFSQLGPLML